MDSLNFIVDNYDDYVLPQMPEEEAFAVLVKIMSVYNLRELFKPSMAELGLRMFQLESLIKVSLFNCPVLHRLR